MRWMPKSNLKKKKKSMVPSQIKRWGEWGMEGIGQFDHPFF